MSWKVWADGSGTTGGPAGIGFVALAEYGAEMSGSLPLRNATNQQAEILAAAYALTKIPERSIVTVISDSEYVVKGWNEYLPQWRAKGWRKKSGGTPANMRHWQRLIEAVELHLDVSFLWTRGHAGTHENELADRLAGEARRLALTEVA
jgi:ribonuclease HI